MFGDVPIFGSFTCSIDEKGRIMLPSYLKPEKGDTVAVCASDFSDDCFDVYPIDMLNEQITRLDELILTSTDDVVVERAESLRRNIFGSVLMELNVDSSRRLVLNTPVLARLGITSTKLYGLGERKSIKFFGSADSYEKYTGRPYIKAVRKHE